jgi:periplasmic protein TonB
MFEQAVLSNGPASKRVWTTFAGVTGQALLVTFAVMIPMIWPEAMPSHQSLLRIFVPGVPPGPRPKDEAAAPRVTHAAPKQWNGTSLHLPTQIPDKVAILDEPPDLGGPVRGYGTGIPGGTGTGPGDGVLAGMDSLIPVVPPPRPIAHVEPASAPPAPRPIERVTIGGLVKLGEPIRRVEPRYPPIAAQARISGVVELVAVVGVDGRIRELTLKSGNALLVPAAMEAVRQWLYRPTTLNGNPVEVISPITVTFRLN